MASQGCMAGQKSMLKPCGESMRDLDEPIERNNIRLHDAVMALMDSH